MKASAFHRLLVTAFHQSLGVAAESSPGVGKTSIVTAAAAEAGQELIIEHPSIADPTDYKGLPVMQKDGTAKFAPIGLIARLLKITKRTIVCADDFGQAAHATQAAFMQLVHGGRLNDVQLRTDLITWVLLTNGTGDRAAVNALLEPVKSRFHTLVTLECDVNDWCQWAYASGKIAPEIIAFIRFKPDLLNKFEPSRDFKNCPSPRTVHHASDLFLAGLTDKDVIAGAVGEGWALDFLSFLRVYQDLPSLDGILLEPSNAKVPTTIGARWAVSTGLVKRASKENLGRIVTYLKRLSTSAGTRDFEVMTMKDIIKAKPDATESADFGRWASDNDDVMG
jgi:hypothetical protein